MRKIRFVGIIAVLAGCLCLSSCSKDCDCPAGGAGEASLYFEVDNHFVHSGYFATMERIYVYSNAEWLVAKSASWISFQLKKPTDPIVGNLDLKMDIDPNPKKTSREALITFTYYAKDGERRRRLVTVMQDGNPNGE